MFALSVSPPVQYRFASLFSYPDYCMAYDESTVLWHILLHLKLLRPWRKKCLMIIMKDNNFNQQSYLEDRAHTIKASG